MELTRQEENRNRLISGSITALLFTMLLLLLIWWQIVTPNPPFPESGGGGGQELALGMMEVGNDNIDYGSMGAVTNVVAEQPKAEEKIVTSEDGEPVAITEAPAVVKEDKTVIKPVKETQKPVVKEKTEAEKQAEKFTKQLGKGGGNNNASTPGQPGSEDGKPNSEGNGGSGTGTQGGDGPGDGPGSGPGFGGGSGGGIGIDLKGRAVVQPPRLPKDTQEEGKVVVEITVDSEGNVIEADPNGRGTNTPSAILKAKARQAAMATKFSVDGRYPTQKGTITIVFSFN